jgi:hypothetical protein
MAQALTDRTDRPDELVASGHQVEMIFRRGQKALSLRAAKMWHLLIKAAGARLSDNVKHCIPLADLYQAGLGHMTQDERIETLRELQQTLVEVTTESPKIRGGLRTVSGALLSSVERDHDDRGDLEWYFSPALLVVFASSEHWAVLSKRAVMAFESRYSLRFYEIMTLRGPLDHLTSQEFKLDELRDRLGVPVGKLEKWFDFRRFVLEPAIAEVNHLSGLTISYEPMKRGRSVVAIKLTWAEKSPPERKATKRELDAPKVGRKARREGTAETIVTPASPLTPTSPDLSAGFPVGGSIHYGAWGDIARKNLPKNPTPDVDMVADAFRRARLNQRRPLKAGDVQEHFANFCKRWGSPAS